MDLFDKIEKTGFLGQEFILWTWWKSELFDGQMELDELGSFEI